MFRHCKWDWWFVIVNGTGVLSLQKERMVCHCKRDGLSLCKELVFFSGQRRRWFVIIKGTASWSL